MKLRCKCVCEFVYKKHKVSNSQLVRSGYCNSNRLVHFQRKPWEAWKHFGFRHSAPVENRKLKVHCTHWGLWLRQKTLCTGPTHSLPHWYNTGDSLGSNQFWFFQLLPQLQLSSNHPGSRSHHPKRRSWSPENISQWCSLCEDASIPLLKGLCTNSYLKNNKWHCCLALGRESPLTRRVRMHIKNK